MAKPQWFTVRHARDGRNGWARDEGTRGYWVIWCDGACGSYSDADLFVLGPAKSWDEK